MSEKNHKSEIASETWKLLESVTIGGNWVLLSP